MIYRIQVTFPYGEVRDVHMPLANALSAASAARCLYEVHHPLSVEVFDREERIFVWPLPE